MCACAQVLFRIIPKEEEVELKSRYAGTQAERSSGADTKKASDKGASMQAATCPKPSQLLIGMSGSCLVW